MLGHMFPHFGHRITHCNVVVEELSVSAGIPIREGWKLLRDGVEETNDDTNGGGLHVGTEFVDGSSVWNPVMAIELHLFPNSKENGGNHEDGGPVLESIAAVYAGV